LAALARHRGLPLPCVRTYQTTGPDGTTVTVGELAGYGPLTAEAANWLLEVGAAVDLPKIDWPRTLAVDGHDPPPLMAATVNARDGTCRFPGCRRNATRCDHDHTIAYPEGPTCPGNLAALCRRHHRAKQSGRWTVSQDDQARMMWTCTITGHKYLTTHADSSATGAAPRSSEGKGTQRSCHSGLPAQRQLRTRGPTQP
jgi:hypothetical protein